MSCNTEKFDGPGCLIDEASFLDIVSRLCKLEECCHLQNPGDPALTYLWDTGSSLLSETILDRWSDDKSYYYKFRIYATYGDGIGWNYFTIPTIAGFQQPIIYEIGTYRPQSNEPQDDNVQGSPNTGASPQGPYMGKEAHHWSSTNRIYHGYYRRDNTYNMYTEFIVKYIKTPTCFV